MIDVSMIAEDEDYLVDALAMLKSIIGQMGRHIDRLCAAKGPMWMCAPALVTRDLPMMCRTRFSVARLV